LQWRAKWEDNYPAKLASCLMVKNHLVDKHFTNTLQNDNHVDKVTVGHMTCCICVDQTACCTNVFRSNAFWAKDVETKNILKNISGSGLSDISG